MKRVKFLQALNINLNKLNKQYRHWGLRIGPTTTQFNFIFYQTYGTSIHNEHQKLLWEVIK